MPPIYWTCSNYHDLLQRELFQKVCRITLNDHCSFLQYRMFLKWSAWIRAGLTGVKLQSEKLSELDPHHSTQLCFHPPTDRLHSLSSSHVKAIEFLTSLSCSVALVSHLRFSFYWWFDRCIITEISTCEYGSDLRLELASIRKSEAFSIAANDFGISDFIFKSWEEFIVSRPTLKIIIRLIRSV